MLFAAKLLFYFILWTLYSYGIHVLAHTNFKGNFVSALHLRHHAYKYQGNKWPPLHDYFFWFGTWRGTLDVWITFTLPLIVLAFFEPAVAAVLLVFHYIYEVFLSRDILDHNPNITGPITRFVPVGAYHLKHHRNFRCNYSFYISIWDHVFKTVEKPRSSGAEQVPLSAAKQ
jgi:sterol desaturase/sphingolipid hydroxylase (fatty acid hydroxylase superfamily)